jgi:hypothetical protein
MESAEKSPIRKRLEKYLRRAFKTVAALGLWIGEIYVIDRWYHETFMFYVASSIIIGGIGLMFYGLDQLKKASETQGVEPSYFRGVKIILCASLLISGVSLGSISHSPYVYYTMPQCDQRDCF